MKKVVFVILALLLVGGAGAGAFVWLRIQRVDQFSERPYGDDSAKVVDVPIGTGPRQLSRLLHGAGVVSSADDLYAFIRKEKLAPRLKAGEYEFAGPLSPRQVLEKIASGQVKLYRFTVREGLRVDETLLVLAASELKLDLSKLQVLAQSKPFIRKVGVPADSLEGFLYPDTYSFTRGATEEAVLTKMVARALEEYATAKEQTREGIQLSPLQTFTLASIIEKETGVVEERPRISCVFHNRLRKDMKLQTDPTVLYAMMLKRGSFVKNITKRDLETPHPYNTYTTTGLPPGPIASPGAAALQAALNPIDCQDLFFVSRNDGTHIFCPDLRCHEAAVKRWQIDFFRRKTKG